MIIFATSQKEVNFGKRTAQCGLKKFIIRVQQPYIMERKFIKSSKGRFSLIFILQVGFKNFESRKDNLWNFSIGLK